MADVSKPVVKRTRNFATVVYPESCPSDFLEILKEFNIPAFVSPLHDLDVNADGEPKKEHYHVMIMFDSVKTEKQAQEVFNAIGGVGCEIVNSVRGYARYLCHLDNPEKHQYNIGDVTCIAGADYYSVITLASDRYAAIGEMMDYCNLNEIFCFSDLLFYARDNRFDWYKALCDNSAFIMKEFLQSMYWKWSKLHEE